LAIAKTLKYSKQRKAIKDFLLTRYDHPTADTVYANIKELYPNISLGTVYRNLSLLSEIGEIRKITTGDGADRFDGNTLPHDHFMCRNCCKVLDLEIDSIDYMKEIAAKNFSGIIEKQITYFYGLCGDCIQDS
jgi:Fe2+/Zn2+ uptake regulation proteins